MTKPFVPPDFEAPTSFTGPGFRLEPLGAEHNERDHEAWMSSIDHIRSTPGFGVEEEKGWPEPMSLESNLEDLVMHARHFEERRGFTYSILDGDEVIGCIYIYPSRNPDGDADISNWVTVARAAQDRPIRQALAAWVDDAWPFETPNYFGA